MGSRITVDGDCSHEIKRHLLLGKKAGVFPTLIHCLIQYPRRSNWRTPALTHLSINFHEAGHRGVWRSAGRPRVPFLPAASPPSTFEHFQTQHSTNEDHGIWSHHFMANRWGNNGNSERLFSWAPQSLQIVTAAMKSKDACSLEEKLER